MPTEMRMKLDGFVSNKSWSISDRFNTSRTPLFDSPLAHLQADVLPIFEIELLPEDKLRPTFEKAKKESYPVIDVFSAIPVERVTLFSTSEQVSSFAAEDNYDATYGKKQAKIRRRLKNKIMKKNMMGTPANKWSARKSQELKRQYEAACERAGLRPYKGKKTSKQQDLSDWSKQGWRTASGRKSSVTGEPYFPAKAVAALKRKGLYAKAKRQKAKAIKEKKNARYSDDIREVVGQYRAENKNYKTCDNCGRKNHLYVLDEETVCVTCIESYEDNWEQIFGRRPDIRGLGA